MKLILIRIAVVLAVISAILAVLTFKVFWRSPPFYTEVIATAALPILKMSDYRTGHPRPYIVKRENLVLFGSRHTTNPSDPQMAQIEDAWNELRPTVALVEGRLGFLFPGFMNPVKQYGEMGKVNALAKRDNVKVYSWDLPKEQAVAMLLESKKYSSEQIALYQILLPYFSNLRHGKPESPDDFVKEFLHRGKYPGLENTIGNISDIDRLWKRDFSGEKDWRDTSDEYGLPGYLGDIGQHYNDIRNYHLAALILHLLDRHEKVFVIAGSSHAVAVEPALP